jgi:hypothetical protein
MVAVDYAAAMAGCFANSAQATRAFIAAIEMQARW